MALADIYIEKQTNPEYDENNLDEYIYAREEASVNGEEISLNGHTFELNREVPELGDYIGPAGELPARISKIEYTVDKEAKTISVTVSAVRLDNVESPQYKYYIKEENGEYVEKTTQEGNTYTFTELKEKKYTIKVELIGGINENYPEGLTTSKEIEVNDLSYEVWDGQSNDKVIAVVSDDNVTVPVPHGFVASKATGEKTVGGGFVIYQGETEVNDSNVEDSMTSRNQFVWIPVEDYTTMYTEVEEPITLSGVTTTTNVYSKLRVRSGDSYSPTIPGVTSGIREPDVLTSYDTDYQYYRTILGYESTKDMADAMVAEYKATYESIKYYGGFYIGRYELTGSVENPTVQKGAVLANQNWYNLKKACTNIVSTEFAQTTMIYGNQWDEAIAWLKTKGYNTDTDSTSWGNYNNSTGNANITGKGSPQITGYSKAWSAQNIYDLAGNYWEWTQEALYASLRVIPGGGYYYSGSGVPASCRDYNDPNNPYSFDSSRPALYVALSADS